jgi:hypothetical protein
MQDGDLELWNRPRYIVVVEGVLCRVDTVIQSRRLRADKVTGYNASWYDVPIKRLLYLKDRWPDTGQDLVTFVSQDFADQAASFLDEVGLQYDEINYRKFSDFTTTLIFQRDVQAVYDSDPARLDRYGQLGHAVVAGEDF